VKELEALRRENAEQRGQLAALAAQIAQLIAQEAELIGQLARLNDRVAELLAAAQRKQRKPSMPSAAPSPTAPLVVERAEQRAFEERPKAPAKPIAEHTPKK
jgi:septal ring factor EnvC (AmiA/AmiB activator)